MNKLIIGGVALIASLGVASSAQASQLFTAVINGDKIVDLMGNPAPTNSQATGVAEFELNDAQTELSYSITLNNLLFNTDGGTLTRIHLHTGFPNQRSAFHVLNIYGQTDDADVIFEQTTGPITISGIWSDADYCVNTSPKAGFTCDNDPDTTKKLSDYVDELLAGGLYVNVHTTRVPSGEIRGNLTLLATPPAQDPATTPEPGSIFGLVTVLGLAGLTYRKKNG